MSSGFFAGSIPPWAYVVGGCLGIGLVLIGMWAGYGRGFKHAEEETRWAREQAKVRPAARPAHEAWQAHEDQALTLANENDRIAAVLNDPHPPIYWPEPVLEPTAVLRPEEMSWTGEIQRMTAAFEEDMARIMGGTDDQLREITR